MSIIKSYIFFKARILLNLYISRNDFLLKHSGVSKSIQKATPVITMSYAEAAKLPK